MGRLTLPEPAPKPTADFGKSADERILTGSCFTGIITVTIMNWRNFLACRRVPVSSALGTLNALCDPVRGYLKERRQV
jgi:hypothetical protein